MSRLFRILFEAVVAGGLVWMLAGCDSGGQFGEQRITPDTPRDEFGVPLTAKKPAMTRKFLHEKELIVSLLGETELQIPDVVPEGVGELHDVEFCRLGERCLLLDLYLRKDLSTAVPGMILLGGTKPWQASREEWRPFALRYAKRGYVCASIDYRGLGEARFPAPLQDCRCAIRWMRSHASDLHVDPDRIVVVGRSSGAHLALLAAYAPSVPEFEGTGGFDDVSSAVQAVISLYGFCDLTDKAAQAREDMRGFLMEFLGKSFDKAPNLYREASPIAYVSAACPPTLLVHGAADTMTPCYQSRMLAERLQEAGAPCEYDEVPGMVHLFDMVNEGFVRVQWDINAFLKRYIDKPPSGS